MKLSELKQSRSAVLDKMEALASKAIEEKREFTEEEAKQYDAWKAEETQLEGQIKRLEEIQTRKAACATPAATPIGGGNVQRDPAQPKPERVKGQHVAHMVRALSACNGNYQAAAQYAEGTLGNPEVAQALAVGPVVERTPQSNDGASGGYLVQEQYSTDFIELLRASQVVYQAGPRIVPMPAGNLTLGKQTGGASASYGDEGDHITASSPTFGQVKLSAKKLTALSPISNDLIRYATPQADQIIVNDLVMATALKADYAFLRGDGTAGNPKGMRNWAASANVNAINGTVNAVNVEADVVQKLVAKLANSNVPLNALAVFMPPRVFYYLRYLRETSGYNFVFPEMAEGMLAGAKIFQSTQIPTNLGGGTESEVTFANMAHVLVGETLGVRIDVSQEASYWDGSALQSTFDRDQTVVRVIVEHDMGVRHPEAIAVLTGVTWGA